MSDRASWFPGDGELAELMRTRDWGTTALGPVEQWPNALRTAVRIVLTSRFSMWMGWGDDLTFFYNDAYRRDTLGSKHPRSLGAPAREVWSEIWTDIGPRIAGVLADGRSTWDEGLMLFLERDGYPEETYHTFSYSPLHDDAGAVRGVLCVVTEDTGRLITERRVALLGKLAAELAGVSSDDGVMAGLARSLATAPRDLPFTLTYLVPVGASEAGRTGQTGFPGAPALVRPDRWPLAEVLETGRACEVVLDDAELPTGPWPTPPVRAYLMPIVEGGQARPAGVLVAALNPYRAFDGPYREFLALLVGQLGAGLASARAYERERQRAESLAELDRAKTAFFSNVSHEFRTPLTLMLGPLEGLLAEVDVAPALHDELATIHRNALRLLKLVNTMLDFSRIEAGRATAQFQPLDLAQLTTDLASVFRAATEKAGLRLVVDCPPLAAPVPVDRDMWEKIVLNLVSNAFKFTLDGEIAVGLARRDDQVELTVRDTGIGIPAAELAHVFERFHRVEGSRGRTHEGTGIGLALVQELVRLHGGTIAVASEPGRGTTFTVSIPAGEPQAAAAPLEARAGKPNAFVEEAMRWLPDAPPAADAIAPASRERVLVADDNADMRAYLGRLLGKRWDVELVANGRAALAAMARRRPELVLTDVMMPELDGFGLIAAIRADPALRDVPVVVLSARAGEDARVEGLQAGADDYVVKPFSAPTLIAHVEAQLLRAALTRVDQRQARRLAAIFEQAPALIAVVRGPEHVFEMANAPYLRVVGGRDVVGRRVADALPELVPQGIVDVFDRVYRTGEPFVGNAVPIQLQPAGGGPLEERVFDVVYQPVRDHEGRVTGIAAIGHDVTDLAHARREAETANQAKDEFLAMLGHELRNPLAPIMTALELMKLRDVGGQRERALIERQVRHLVGLVDDLLDVSRITRGKVELHREPTEIADVVSRSIEVVSPLLEQRRHALTVDAPRGQWVDGDPTRLAQIVSNLLSNAARYTPAGGHITVQARAVDGAITIDVIDDGIGIEPAMQPHVFEPFIQGKQAIDRAQGGLGLGLAIVDNLVRLHGGTVGVESAGRGHGSRFTVVLPAIAAVAPPALAPAPPAPGASVSPRARVLVVDDNVDAAETLAEMLERDGYDARAVFDGPSALKAIEDFVPRLAILDLGLPVMDGFELARLLRAQPSLAATRLVAVTGYGQAEDRAATTTAGFAAHLVKPVDLHKLRETMRTLLEPE